MSEGRLRRESGGPMYQQLRQELLARIRRGEFPPGSVLPSENRLCEEYGVSVTTARRAFLELVKEGVVRRQAGVGTMVSSRVRRAQLAFVSIDYVGDAWRHNSSIMGEMLAGIGEYAWRHESSLTVSGVDDENSVYYLQGLAEDRAADGVLLRTANDVREDHLIPLERAGIPYVAIKRQIPGRPMNCVTSDDAVGARLATSYLLELGHRRVGFVCAKPHIILGQERLEGYRRAMEDRGLVFDPLLVRQREHFTMEMGYEAVAELLAGERPPTAILVASDTMALGAYQATWDAGLSIPEDLSLVGYDDIPSAAAVQPPMTTIRTSYYEFGRLATQLVLDLIDGREDESQVRSIQPSLMIRDSTAPPRSIPGIGARRRGDSGGVSASDPAVSPDIPDDFGRGVQDLPREQTLQGRLSGRRVICFGEDLRILRSLAHACEAEGGEARIYEELSRGTEESGSASILCVVDGYDMVSGLREARSVGEDALTQVRGGDGLAEEVVVLAMFLDAEGGTARREAARAGLSRVVEDLASQARPGVRVSGLLSVAGDPGGMVGPAVVFLASPEAAGMHGETLAVGGPRPGTGGSRL